MFYQISYALTCTAGYDNTLFATKISFESSALKSATQMHILPQNMKQNQTVWVPSARVNIVSIKTAIILALWESLCGYITKLYIFTFYL